MMRNNLLCLITTEMDNLVTLGWYALLIAMAGDIIISLLLPVFYKGYSISKTSISALGNPQSPVRIPFNIWMLTEGILFLTAIPAVYERYIMVSKGLTVLLIIFTAAFAVGACIFTCFFSVNESKEVVTLSSRIHGAGSVIGFMLFLFVPLLIAVLSFKNKEGYVGGISIACFVVALAFFVLFVMSDKEEFSHTMIANEGLWQRLNLMFMYLPLGIIAVRQIL
ncbi:Protein of unknown function [Ruminococcaceae bacterium YRB3002]|nr:Protein of unknown function [Ruminococcaceae bacterium YRB3002]